MPVALDHLAIFLLAVNILSFALHAIDLTILRRVGTGTAGQVALGILTLAGGAAGTLVALLLWDRRIAKDNSLRYVLAISAAIIWAVVLGFRYVTPFDAGSFVDNLRGVSIILIAYLALINLVTFVCFAIDKGRATRGAWRVREATLLGLSLAGGSLGGLCAMLLLRHKIRSPQFAWGLPMMLVAWLAFLAFLVNTGLVS